MIVFVTVPHHAYTVAELVKAGGTAGMPEIRAIAWHRFWRAEALPRAAYILGDIERLSAHERRLAVPVRAALLAAGLPCLNDPLRIPTRHGLLLRLHEAGLNPFRAWRAEDRPRPGRFPVFLRLEAEHGQPIGGLLDDQAVLEAALDGLPAAGIPATGVLVVEYCAEPIAPGVWRKFGTFRIGEAMSTDHAVIQDHWCVKYGKRGVATEEMVEREHAEVAANAHAAALRPAFDAAGIEWGRADHATVGGREVVYEINTNPSVDALAPQRLKLREETLRIARARMAAALAALDVAPGAEVPIVPDTVLATWRERSPRGPMAWRP